MRLTFEAPAAGAPAPTDLIAAIDGGRIRAEGELRALSLLDAHVVEAVAIAVGAVVPPKAKLRCRNCDAALELSRAAHFPLQPLLDGARDEELDAHAAPGDEHPLPKPIAIGRARSARTFRLAPRALGDRPRLVALLGDPCADALPPLPTGPALVRAIGLQLGEVKSPVAVARALDALDDDDFAEAWGAIARAWDETHYTPRLLAPSPCPRCGARHDVEVPPRLVLDTEPADHPRAGDGEGDGEGEGEPEARFPSLDAFKARAARIAREELAKAGLEGAHGLEIVVDDDVPPCDDGGEPLLGSYTPRPEAERDAPTRAPFEIALYFRTFASMFEEEPYDVDAEIRETIAHELEHHEGFLAGHDPLDDEERAAIAREHRRLHGHGAAAELRAGAGWLARDVLGFLRTTWPLWLITAIAIGLVIAAER